MTYNVFSGTLNPTHFTSPTMIVVDDHMSDVNQLVADIFTKISHHRDISMLYVTQNLFDKTSM